MYDVFLNDWLNILRNCNYDNTYKMAWAKAITEISVEINNLEYREEIEITLEKVAEKVLKYYWDQTIFFDLVQGSNPIKPPKILSLTKELIEVYNKLNKTNQPRKFDLINFNTNLKDKYIETINKVVAVLKQDVSYRFLNLNGKTYENIYKYKKGWNSLFIKKENIKILRDYQDIIFETIHYRWALILETFNTTPRICKKVKIIDDIDISRKPLNKFIKYLNYENSEHICFICGKKIENDLSVDHVIPWSYLYSDDLWNLVYVHKSCNSSKSNMIPDRITINKLENRNIKLYEKLKDELKDKFVEELKVAIEKNYVQKFWIASQG